jgi:hypothetical protein
VGQVHVVEVDGQDRGNRRARLLDPCRDVLGAVAVNAARPDLPRGHLGHRGGALRRERPGERGVQVDARVRGREGLAERRDLLRIRHGGPDHGRMIPTMPVTPAAPAVRP